MVALYLALVQRFKLFDREMVTLVVAVDFRRVQDGGAGTLPRWSI